MKICSSLLRNFRLYTFAAFIIIFFSPLGSLAQRYSQLDTATTEGLASMAEMNQPQARTAALNEARAEAVRIVAGVKIQSESIGIKSESIQQEQTTSMQDFLPR